MPTTTVINRVLKLIKEAGSEGLTARDLLLHDVGTRAETYEALKQLRGKDVQMQKEGRFVRYRASFMTPALQEMAEGVIKEQRAVRRHSSTRAYYTHLPEIVMLTAEKAIFEDRSLSLPELFRLAEREHFEKKNLVHLMRQPASLTVITGFFALFQSAHQALLTQLLDKATAPSKLDWSSVSDAEFLTELQIRAARLNRPALHRIIDTTANDHAPVTTQPAAKVASHCVITLVGLKGEQFALVCGHGEIAKRLAAKTLVLRNVELSGAGNLNGSIPRSSNEVVALVSMINHGVWAKIQLRHSGHAHTVKGLTIMKDTVTRLALEWEKRHGIGQPADLQKVRPFKGTKARLN